LPQSSGVLFDFNEKSAIHIIKGLRPYELPRASVFIIHYLLLRGWKDILPEYGFKTVIFDEIQELRHTGTEKYSAASLVAKDAQNVIGLSGTPIYNHGGEIWNVLNIIEYHCLGDWDSFTREWCTGYGSDIVKDPGMLGSHLKREGLMLRRTKKEVLKELPPKRRVIQTVDFNEGVYGELIQSAIKKAHEIDGVMDYFERGRLKRDIVDETRQAIGIAKAPYVAAFVKMLLDAGERVLLFGYHHRVFDIYQEELLTYHPVFITGRQTSQQKDEAVQSFKSGRTNICCISLRAAAGIDGLQSGTCVVFGELDWAPAIHSQAEDRIQRIGVNEELDSILCYYLVAEAGTDEAIQEVLGLKVSQFVGIMGDKEETEEDRLLAQTVAGQHMDKVVEELKKRRVA
jgi:SNF2 family DNA or RNA helicase